MKSKISLFNAGVSKNLLRRCWPLWTSYLAMLIFALPLNIYNGRYYLDGIYTVDLNADVLNSGMVMLYLSMAVGLLAAMAMFSYLYNSRSCGMMAALPVRRETMFVTAYLTGLMPLVISDVLVMLVTAAFTVGSGIVGFKYLLVWLAMAVMANVAFYSFAVFCAMLTGSAVILPVVYVVLNLAVWVAENCVRYLLDEFVYGMSVQSNFFDWLSPIVKLAKSVSVFYPANADGSTGAVWVSGLGTLAAYCAAGLLLAGLALLLYRRRNMETATDAVAIPVLKPVFKYCMAIGCAVVFAWAAYDLFFGRAFRGFAVAVVITGLMFAGAFIGYFAAEMLMQKTVKVFTGKWRGYVIVCCLLTVLTMCFELDVFGYERKVPELEQVEQVYLDDRSQYCTNTENIQQIMDMHRQIIAHKTQNDYAEDSQRVSIVYVLKNGRSETRVYSVDFGAQAQQNPDSDILYYQRMINLQELIDQRAETSIPVKSENISRFSVDCYNVDEYGAYQSDYITLDTRQAMEFYEQCLLPDLHEGKIGRRWLVENDDYYDTVTNVSIYIELGDRSAAEEGNGKAVAQDYLSFTLCADASRCMDWILENTDIHIMTLREADPPLDNESGIYPEAVY